VVFAVKSPLPRPVINCYQKLSLSIAKVLMKEEANDNYLSNQAKLLNDFICEHQNLNDKSKPFRLIDAFNIHSSKPSLFKTRLRWTSQRPSKSAHLGLNLERSTKVFAGVVSLIC